MLTVAGRLKAQPPLSTLLLTDGHTQCPPCMTRGSVVLVPATQTLIAMAVGHLAMPGRTVIATTSPRTHLLLTFALHDAGASLTEHGSVLIART